jgi:hypothetical protein
VKALVVKRIEERKIVLWHSLSSEGAYHQNVREIQPQQDEVDVDDEPTGPNKAI